MKKQIIWFTLLALATILGGCQLLSTKQAWLPLITKKLRPSELTVNVTDAKTEKPIEGASVVLQEIIACPDLEGYPCPQGLGWQFKTNKQGQAFFDDQGLKEYVAKNLAEHGYILLALNVSAQGYQTENKEVLYSPNKELIKKDFGLSPPGDQRIIYNPKEKVFAIELFGEGLVPPSPKETPSDLESRSRSAGYIYFPDFSSSRLVEIKRDPSGNVVSRSPLEKVRVYLYAPDEIVTKVEDVYCGAPVLGATLYRGHYQLILDASTLTMEDPGFQPHIKPRDSKIDIGEYEFVEGTYHDGQIVVDQLDPNDYRNFIIIYSYGSCNSETIRVYGYDLLKDSLVLYKFRDRSGKVEDSACLSVTASFPAKPLTKSGDGNLITRCYSQITGKNEVSEWKFIPEKEEFQEIKHYQESF